MKNLLFALAGVILLLFACKTLPEEAVKTTLSYFTIYQDSPESLNGQIKVVEEKNYLPIQSDGDFIKGKLLNKKMRDSLGVSMNFTATFDKAGNILQVERYYDEGDTRIWKVEYDDGKMIKASYFRLDTLRYYYDDITHDESGNAIIGSYYRASDNEQIISFENSYTDNGFWKESWSHNSEGKLLYHYKWNFNEKNQNLSYEEFDANDSLLLQRKFEYGEEGFFIRSENFDASGNQTAYLDLEYTKFDEMGNWVESKLFIDGKLVTISERNYDYY